jgi:hypothetical protein
MSLTDLLVVQLLRRKKGIIVIALVLLKRVLPAAFLLLWPKIVALFFLNSSMMDNVTFKRIQRIYLPRCLIQQLLLDLTGVVDAAAIYIWISVLPRMLRNHRQLIVNV